jgi:mevalonate kinase
MSVEATAPGKAILFGEHSVVYRGPAIVLAIDRRAKVVAQEREDDSIFFDSLDLGFSGYFREEKYIPVHGEVWRGKRLQAFFVAVKKTMEHLGVKSGLTLTIRSEIPIAAGLGSSAAVCVATVAAVGGLLSVGLTQEEICKLAYEGEKVVHGTPSGVDNNISTYGGILKYEKSRDLERFEVDDMPSFVIGDSRRKRSTGRLVGKVKMLREREPELVDKLIDSIATTSESGLKALMDRDFYRLGDLMNINHGLLSALGVSISKLDRMVHSSRGAGAYGAKLTGAGGGGCMLALGDKEDTRKIQNAIKKSGGVPYVVNVTYDGVKVRRLE